MLKFDFLKSKSKFASKLKDRQRLKGCSFSNFKFEPNINSATLDEFRKKRMQKKLLREKELNSIKNNWQEIRRQLMQCIRNKDTEDDNKIESFSNNLDFFMKRFDKKNLIRQDEYLANKKKDITEIKERRFYINAFDDIINDIKNKSYNFYKVINDSNIKEEIKEKNNYKTFKFYKDFLSFFKNLKRSSSAKNIKSSIFTKINFYSNNKNNNKTIAYNKQKNLYLYYSSLLPKKNQVKRNYYYLMNRINKANEIKMIHNLDKKSDSLFNNQNLFLKQSKNITANIMQNRTENNKSISPNKKYILDNSIKNSLNKTTNNFKSKINLKRAYIKNSSLNSNKCKYLLKNIQKIQIRPKEDDSIRREKPLTTTFSNIDNDSKTNENITMFRLKKSYISSLMPNDISKASFQRKIFFNKLKSDLLK